MKKIFNSLFSFLKIILLVASFGITLYIIVGMFQRLNKNIMESKDIFIPFAILIILFVINILRKQKGVNDNIFYNITCCLVFSAILFAGYRAIFDTNMIYNEKLGYNINFVYYNDFISFLKTMLYGLIISNVFLIFSKEKKKMEVKEEII